MYVLDTNVLSMAAPTASNSATAFASWLRDNERYCYISVVTVAEISYGISNLQWKGASRKASLLRDWYKSFKERFHEHIINLDPEVAAEAGKFLVIAKYQGKQISSEDAIIAATAYHLDSIVVTHNLKDFEDLPPRCLEPSDVMEIS